MRLVIIGAGPGGYETALLAAEKGVDVTLVEYRRPGGTCLNEGCIPTKALCRSAVILEELRHAGDFGITGLEYGFDFAAAMSRKDRTVSRLQEGLSVLLRHPRITLVHGKASFIDSRTVKISETGDCGAPEGLTPADEGSAGERIISGDNIIIATGSVPSSLDIPGASLPGVVDSSQLLATADVPGRLAVIGGGVIGLEFASVFRSFGSEVTVLEYCHEILPRFDRDIAKRLRQCLSGRGICFVTDASVQSVDVDGAGSLTVDYLRKGAEGRTGADIVLMAVGRRPALHTLNLDEAGIIYTGSGICVDENMETNVPGVYAIGDITGGVMLAHAASMQGAKALNHILGLEDRIDLSVMPAAVFTIPEAAAVGMTEEECRAEGIGCSSHKAFFRANGKAMCTGETDGLCKLVTDGDGYIRGCHVCGPHASDIVQEAAALMSSDATLPDIRNLVHIHPAFCEVLRSASMN